MPAPRIFPVGWNVLPVAYALLAAGPVIAASAREADPASLDRLHDIVLPDPVSWWPPGPVWAVVGYMLAAVLLLLGALALRSWNANRYRRLALRELAQIERSGKSALEAIPALLKRTAMVAFGRSAVASLSGERWCRFLAGSSRSFREAGKPTGFFLSAAYLPDATADMPSGDRRAVINAARSWIRDHRVRKTDTKKVART